jgi:hypothetical protein
LAGERRASPPGTTDHTVLHRQSPECQSPECRLPQCQGVIAIGDAAVAMNYSRFLDTVDLQIQLQLRLLILGCGGLRLGSRKTEKQDDVLIMISMLLIGRFGHGQRL